MTNNRQKSDLKNKNIRLEMNTICSKNNIYMVIYKCQVVTTRNIQEHNNLLKHIF